MSEATIALLPIHPEYASAILDGLKKVEFRKRLFKRDVNKILIYACYPVMSLVGYFDVNVITESTPKQAWRKYGAQGCIEKKAYVAYYSGAEKAVAIEIKNVVKFDKPVNLSAIDSDITPPQSYRYIHPHQFNNVLEKAS
jgi:predicted transcriptional regulator